MRLNYHQFYWSTKLYIPYITQRGPTGRLSVSIQAVIYALRGSAVRRI